MNQLCELVGCEFPLFAFSHCRDVVAAVSHAGGFGVLGGSSFTAEQLEIELKWIDDHVEGRPYGVDILVPENLGEGKDVSGAELAELVPRAHRSFVVDLLGRYGIETSEDEIVRMESSKESAAHGEALMDVAFAHPIRLIASALGIAPKSMLERAKAAGVPVAALVGAVSHAIRQVEAGVDILVAQGGEAGGHCGEVSTLVLVPEVLAAIRPIRSVPVLAAGGIMTGHQMAGMMTMGAQGAWTGSVWLATHESECTETFKQKVLAASSRDTVRSKARTGKPSRQLRSAWHDAWEGPDSPGALSMPLMGLISYPAFRAIDGSVERGNQAAVELVSYFVGQGVGLVDSLASARQVVERFKQEFADAMQGVVELLAD
jgi:NAD(P)H-dependent flavin oxidoreductase YrpB (nitropropane dioxygenase family)